MKSTRSKKCDISPFVKKIVWERDDHCCILCGNKQAMPNAHYIPRSKGGLGIKENIVTLCSECHRKLDQSTEREALLKRVKEHLEIWYPCFQDEERIYRR